MNYYSENPVNIDVTVTGNTARLIGQSMVSAAVFSGSSFSNTISTIKTLEPNAEVVPGLSIRDSSIPSSKTEIKEWVKNN